MRGWQWGEHHGVRYRRQLWGAVMVQGHHRVQVAVQTRRDQDLVRRANTHIEGVLPQLNNTAVAVVHGVSDHPMLVHTHPKVDSSLTGEIALGDVSRGDCLPVPCFVQMGLLVLHGYVGGEIYYGPTLWILNVVPC